MWHIKFHKGDKFIQKNSNKTNHLKTQKIHTQGKHTFYKIKT